MPPTREGGIPDLLCIHPDAPTREGGIPDLLCIHPDAPTREGGIPDLLGLSLPALPSGVERERVLALAVIFRSVSLPALFPLEQ